MLRVARKFLGFRIMSGCQRSFVRQTERLSLRNHTPYVRMNETSSVSCNTVPFVTQNVLFGGWRLGRQSPMADVNILILNGLKSLLVQPTVFRSSTGGDARPRLFVWVSSPECSVQGAVLNGLGDVLGFD